MGTLGDYKFVHAGPIGLGATMNVPLSEVFGWRFYVLVPDVDDAIGRLPGAGDACWAAPTRSPVATLPWLQRIHSVPALALSAHGEKEKRHDPFHLLLAGITTPPQKRAQDRSGQC
ncbi:hypothetical protein [Belnapia moabensis]|uniref:hypothetical protein n=1 Tax=Belnapia moabensis TaxID=365533 RepID=UPI0014702445|nr:hypothetical protein [Belnapia moabensis]